MALYEKLVLNACVCHPSVRTQETVRNSMGSVNGYLSVVYTMQSKCFSTRHSISVVFSLLVDDDVSFIDVHII